MGDILRMSKSERKALVELNLVKDGKQTIMETSLKLDKCYRQARRINRRFLEEGEQGLVHRNRGRVSNRKFCGEFKQKCLDLYALRMSGFGPTFAAEKFEELGIQVNHETLRGWLIEAGLWARSRKRGPHRKWREPKKHFGEMVQMDGSFHDWFEDGKISCLMNMVDDATSLTFAQFFDGETTVAAMKMLWVWIERYGVPRSLYTDRKNVYVTNRKSTMEEELAGEEPLTAFGKACQKLGIRIIEAHSPQAKGRVERKNGVYQDRLIKDMSFHGIAGIDAGNKWLQKCFLDDINKKFVCDPINNTDFHQTLLPELKLENIFVWEDNREVQSDMVIRWNNRLFQLLGKSTSLPAAKKDVIVQERLNGEIRIVYREKEINYKEIVKPEKIKTKDKVQPPLPNKPDLNHPWRRPFLQNKKNNTMLLEQKGVGYAEKSE